MLPFLLLLVGGGISLYCLWQFRRWLGASDAGSPPSAGRMETLIDELVATAEATTAVVQEKAEELLALVAEADRRIGALREAPPVVPATALEPPVPLEATLAASPAVASPAPVAGNPLHRQVYALADAGQELTQIARSLSLTKGEVQLILGLRK